MKKTSLMIIVLIFALALKICLNNLWLSSDDISYRLKDFHATSPQVMILTGWPLDINSLPADYLIVLPGIGPKLAKRIVEARDQIGGFHSVEDLLKVKGIGEKKFEGLRRYIDVK